MSVDFIASQLDISRALLSPERAGLALTEVPPERDPASLGAVGGIGFNVDEPEITASVYFFEDARGHGEAVRRLTGDLAQAEGFYTLHGSNGGLLFFGRARLDGPHGKRVRYRLAGMAAAFAGDEE
jgi:hypothetical protein